MRWVGVVAFVGLLGLTFVGQARAQACGGGRVATAEGYCCWPAQTWSPVNNRCEGPPACPSGTSGAGADCVPVTEEPEFVEVDDEPAVGEAPPPVVHADPSRGTSIIVPGGPDAGLVGAGIAVFLASWIPPMVVGALLLGSSGRCDGAAGGYFLVPLAGAIIGTALLAGCSDPGLGVWALAVNDGIAQLLGLTLLMIGITRQTRRRVVVQEQARLDVGLGSLHLTMTF